MQLSYDAELRRARKKREEEEARLRASGKVIGTAYKERQKESGKTANIVTTPTSPIKLSDKALSSYQDSVYDGITVGGTTAQSNQRRQQISAATQADIDARLEEYGIKLESGAKDMDRLQGLLNGEYTQENVDAYNAAKNQYLDDLSYYNGYVKRYYELQDEALKVIEKRRAEAEEKMEKARAVWQEVRVTESQGSTAESLLAIGRGENITEAITADEARDRFYEAQSEFNAAAQEYYQYENQLKLAKMGSDTDAHNHYAKAKELADDIEIVQAMLNKFVRESAPANFAERQRELMEKYGTVSTTALLKELKKKQQEHVDALAKTGYDYERLTGYEQSVEDAKDYEKQVEEWKAVAKKHGVGSSAASVLASPLQGVDYVSALIGNIGHNNASDAESYVPLNRYNMGATNFVQTLRETVAETRGAQAAALGKDLFGDKINEEKWQQAGSFLYQTGMSIADSTSQIVLFGPASIYMMGASAASATAADAMERGATNRQALAAGLAAGVAEAVFEKVSVDRLLSPKKITNVKTLIKETGIQGLTEASEELFTEIANIVTDNRIMGSLSQMNLAVEQFMAENPGATREEAEQAAMKQQFNNVLLAGLGGFISGGVMGGVHGSMNLATNKAEAKRVTEAIKKIEDLVAKAAPTEETAPAAPAETETAKPAAQEAGVRKDVTQESPEVTAFIHTGMSLPAARRMAATVEKLRTGAELSSREVNSLISSGKMVRQTIGELTGVTFPEGSIPRDQLLELFISAKDIAAQRAVEAVDTISADEQLQDAQLQAELTDRLDQLEQGSGVAEDSAVEEIGPDGKPLASEAAFTAMYMERNPGADPAVVAALYQQYRTDGASIEFDGRLLNRQGFIEHVKSQFPEGSQPSDAKLEELFVGELSRQNAARKAAPQTREPVKVSKELEAAKTEWEKVLTKAGTVKGIVFDDTLGDKENAYYDRTTGTVHLNPRKVGDAGMLSFILGHELIHAIKDAKERRYFVEDILRTLAPLQREGFSLSQRIRVTQQAYQRHENELAEAQNRPAEKITRDYAEEEVAADLMRELFRDGDMMNRFAETNPTGFQKLIDMLWRLLETVFPKQTKAHRETEALLNKMVALLTETQATESGDGVVTNAAGDAVAAVSDNGNRANFSLSTYDEEGRAFLKKWLDKAVKKKQLTRAEADDILTQLDSMYDICNQFRDVYAPFGEWSDAKIVSDASGNPVFSVVKANGEYSMNLDFSLVCKKRRTLDAVFNHMVKEGLLDEFNFDQQEIVLINDIIRKHGFETACALCFVDSKRFRQGKVSTDFVLKYNRLVMSLVPKGSGMKTAFFNFGQNETIPVIEGGIDTVADDQLDWTEVDRVISEIRVDEDGKAHPTVEQKIAQHLKNTPADRKLTHMGDFMSTRGFDAAQTVNPEVMKLYNSAKGSGGPKAAFSDVQYLGDILKRAQTFKVDKAYAVGGVRVQSFSDYVPRMVFDYVQMFGDLAAKKLPAHAYTKEELFVRQFGLTGIKINMSLIPAVVEGGLAPGLDANGNYVWADESFDFDTARDIQNAEGYSRNCGTIAVGVSDEHIRAMMADPDIRMIIPYHKSGLNPVVAHMNKIDAFKNYTDFQNTRYENGTKLSDADAKAFKFEFNAEMRKLGDPRAAAEAYVRACEAKGYLPKFDQFAYAERDGQPVYDDNGKRMVDENYYKLLIDFSVYDNGAYAPQEAVTMKFPTEDSAFGSMKELIKRGLEEDALLEAKRDREVPAVSQEVTETLRDWESFAEAYRQQHPKATPEEIADQFKQNRSVSEPQQRAYSLDDDYMAAVERGDMETAQRMVDEKAKEAGYGVLAYHGSPKNNITIFDGWRGVSYFTDAERYAKAYAWSTESGDKIISARKAKKLLSKRFTEDVSGMPAEFDSNDSVAIPEDYDGPVGKFFADGNSDAIYYAVSEGEYKQVAGWHTEFVLGEMPVISQETKAKIQSLTDQRDALFDALNASRKAEDDFLRTVVSSSSPVENAAEQYAKLHTETERIFNEITRLENEISKATPRRGRSTFVVKRGVGEEETKIREDLQRRISAAEGVEKPKVYRVYLKMQNPYVSHSPLDGNEFSARFNDGGDPEYTGRVIRKLQKLKDANHDGVIVPSDAAMMNMGEDDAWDEVNDYVVFDSNQIKSADPVTYDAKGNVIPLSKRFDSSNNDIRYSLEPVSQTIDQLGERVKTLQKRGLKWNNGRAIRFPTKTEQKEWAAVMHNIATNRATDTPGHGELYAIAQTSIATTRKYDPATGEYWDDPKQYLYIYEDWGENAQQLICRLTYGLHDDLIEYIMGGDKSGTDASKERLSGRFEVPGSIPRNPDSRRNGVSGDSRNAEPSGRSAQRDRAAGEPLRDGSGDPAGSNRSHEGSNKSYSLDSAHADAVNRGDMDAAQKMVDEAAKKGGFPAKLFHGTKTFGFTKLKTAGVEESDYEWSPFFATDSLQTAQTYSGTYTVKSASEKPKTYSAAELTDEQIREGLSAMGQFNHVTDGNELLRQISDAVKGYAEDIIARVEHHNKLHGDDNFFAIPAEYERLLHGTMTPYRLTVMAEKFSAENLKRDWGKKSPGYFSAEAISKLLSADYSRGAYVSQRGGQTMLVTSAHAAEMAAMHLNFKEMNGNYALYADTTDMLTVDCKGVNWDEISYPVMGNGTYKTRDIAEWAKKHGYSGVIFRNLLDNGGYGVNDGPSNVHVFFHPEQQVKSADPATYDDKGKLIPLSKRFDRSNDDIRYSLKDSDYMAAVEAGDMETAQRMVEFMADISGYTVDAYHGTAADFVAFDMNKSGEIGAHFGTEAQAKARMGIAVTRARDELDYWNHRAEEIFNPDLMKELYGYTDEQIAKKIEKHYAELETLNQNPHERLIRARLKVNNPLVLERDLNDWRGQEFAAMFLAKLNGEDEYHYAWWDDSRVIDLGALNITLDEADRAKLSLIYNNRDVEVAAELMRLFLESKGIDGVKYLNEYEGSKEDYSYIALRPSQVKLAGAVTRDDGGNVIPLSKRFDSSNDDIRYSLDDLDPDFEAWYRSHFDNPADAEESLGLARRYSELLDKYGAMDESAAAVREAPVPKQNAPTKKVGQTVRTVMGAEATPKTRIPTIMEAVVDGKLAHETLPNEPLVNRAKNRLKNEGFNKLLIEWTANVRAEKSTPELVAMGAVLYHAAANSDMSGEQYLDLVSDYVDLMSRSGQSLQAGKILQRLSPEGKLYTAQKTAGKIEEKLRDRQSRKQREAEDAALDQIIDVRDTALQTITDIFEALSEGRKKTRDNIPVEDWMTEVGNRLADQISRGMQDKQARQNPITKTIQQDLLKFAESYALPKGRNLNAPRTAAQRLADYFANREQYTEAWKQAQTALREQYADDPAALEALEKFLQGDLRNGVGANKVMMQAVAEIALAGDTKIRDIVLRTRVGERAHIENRVFNALNAQVKATGADEIVLRDAVTRYVSNLMAESGIDTEKALANDVKKAMHDIGVKMQDIIRQGASSRERVATKVADMLIHDYGVTPEGADEAARQIVNKFEEMAQASANKALENMFKDREARKQKDLLVRFDELVNLGAFTSDRFDRLAAEKIFKVKVQIDHALIEKYRAAKTDAERDDVMDEITTNIAQQIPTTIMEGFTALRYLNMLGNLKTQVRNVLGNAGYQLMLAPKNLIQGGFEALAEKMGLQFERTRGLGWDREMFKTGLKDFKTVQKVIMGGGKYNDNLRFGEDIESKRRIFKVMDSRPGAKAINTALWILEGPRRATNWAMDKGDMLFSQYSYAEALSNYVHVHKINWNTATDAQKDQARAAAIKQAAEATYRDINGFSDMISRIRFREDNGWFKGANMVGQGILPFRKTPANILVRSIEYSPVGYFVAAVNTGVGLYKHENRTGVIINQLSKATTGSILVAVGAFLAHCGKLVGGDDDDEAVAEFEALQGRQPYSLETEDGKSYTIDWLAPEAVPLLIGADAYKVFREEGLSLKMLWEVLKGMTDPILEMSMLQGLNDTLQNAASYGTDDALVRFTGNALWSYLTQGLTNTLGGQIERAFSENTRTTTYVDKEHWMPDGLQRQLGSAGNKIPGKDFFQIPYIDAWGRIDTNGPDNFVYNLLYQLGSPSYYSDVEISEMEKELGRLYEATGDTKVLPDRAPKYFTVNKERLDLDAVQYVEYATKRGQDSYEALTALTASSVYQSLDDAAKAKAIGQVYDAINQMAKHSVAPDYEVDAWVNEAMESKVGFTTYVTVKAATANAASLKENGETIDNSKSLQIMEIIYDMPGLTAQDRTELFEYFANKSTRDYSKKQVADELREMRKRAD